ncbi:unnamed protein product, partial [Laminaria digitata]
THPSFNAEGGKRAVFCKQHALEGMVNVVSRHCSQDTCTKQPSFNTRGNKTAVYCREHAQGGMVDILSKRCSQS